MPIYLEEIPSSPEAFAWIDASGTEHIFNPDTTGYKVLLGIKGRWMPPVKWVEDSIPFIPGSILRDVNVEPLDWDLPVLVTGSTEAQLHQRIRDLMGWMSPKRGTGTFVNTAVDGVTRKLDCRVEGINFVEDGLPHKKLIVSLHAADPYWYAEEAIETTYSQNFGLPDPPFPVTFPWLFPSNVLFAAVTIDNSGDVESWPTWRIVGPGSNPALRNVTTGETMIFSRTLGAGESILVELSRDAVNITDGLGTKLFSTLSNPSVAWAIQPGINQVQVGMSGATDDSSVTLTYTPRYLGP